MQVRNNTFIARPLLPAVRETQPRSEALPERQPQVAQPPVERVVQGELVSESRFTPARVAIERARVLEGQVSEDSRNRSVVQAYLDIEAAGSPGRSALDVIV